MWSPNTYKYCRASINTIVQFVRVYNLVKYKKISIVIGFCCGMPPWHFVCILEIFLDVDRDFP